MVEQLSKPLRDQDEMESVGVALAIVQHRATPKGG